MSKTKSKKKKKVDSKQQVSALSIIDKRLDAKYQTLINEIENFQFQLNVADQKARKKVRKKIKQNPDYFRFCPERMNARKEVIKEMEGDNFLDRIQKILTELAPIIIIIARLIASLIITILNFTPIKMHMSPAMLEKMDSVYKSAMKLS